MFLDKMIIYILTFVNLPSSKAIFIYKICKKTFV